MRRNYSLLPHEKQKIYGFNREAGQIMGWEIIKFDVCSVWNFTTGKDVIVAVLDTGCDVNHPDLKDNILDGYNIIDNNSNVMDENGHGTHVCGTIGAKNNGIGMVGIAPDVKILPIKILNKRGSGKEKDIANGIIWASDNGADIITMSLGSPSPSKNIENAIDYATKKGCVIFCAAGNNGTSSPILYPAKYNTTIAIGSIGKNLNRSIFSCSGDELDFLSPGEDIFSCAPNNSYVLMSGTSMATPFAVGCAALALSFYRKNQSSIRLSQDKYMELFTKVAKPLNNKDYQERKYMGNGIIYPITKDILQST